MLRYIDLFAGCGGLSDGFEASNKFVGLAHVEWEKAPLDTLKNRFQKKWNYKETEFNAIQFDIQNTSGLINGLRQPRSTFPGLKNLISSRVHGVIGGPPCQAYSIAGRIRDENGMQDDYRNFLFESYIKVLKWAQPNFFLFENVPGILSAQPGGVKIVERIKRAFTSAGYVVPRNFEQALFNLESFGIPQRRNRVVILGLRDDLFGSKETAADAISDFYSSFKQDEKVKRIRTCSDALCDLPPIYPTRDRALISRRVSHQASDESFPGHVPRYHNPRDIETFRILAKDLRTGRKKYTSVESLKLLYTERTGKHSAVHKYYVLRPDEPSNTIPAHLAKDGLRHIHWDPDQCRSITVREAARLQAFDDDFIFLGNQSEQYRMIGNAVPPLFAKKVASYLANFFSRKFRV